MKCQLCGYEGDEGSPLTLVDLEFLVCAGCMERSDTWTKLADLRKSEYRSGFDHVIVRGRKDRYGGRDQIRWKRIAEC
jgi:hypothetical protein